MIELLILIALVVIFDMMKDGIKNVIEILEEIRDK
jgi:hypothetical protein